MLIENLCLCSAMPETTENSLVKSEEISLTTKISRLLFIGEHVFDPPANAETLVRLG